MRRVNVIARENLNISISIYLYRHTWELLWIYSFHQCMVVFAHWMCFQNIIYQTTSGILVISFVFNGICCVFVSNDIIDALLSLVSACRQMDSFLFIVVKMLQLFLVFECNWEMLVLPMSLSNLMLLLSSCLIQPLILFFHRLFRKCWVTNWRFICSNALQCSSDSWSTEIHLMIQGLTLIIHFVCLFQVSRLNW